MRRIALLYHAGLIDRKQAVQLLILSAKPEDQQKLCAEWFEPSPELLRLVNRTGY